MNVTSTRAFPLILCTWHDRKCPLYVRMSDWIWLRSSWSQLCLKWEGHAWNTPGQTQTKAPAVLSMSCTAQPGSQGDRQAGNTGGAGRRRLAHPSWVTDNQARPHVLAKLVIRLNWNKHKSVIITDNSHDANHVLSVCYIILKTHSRNTITNLLGLVNTCWGMNHTFKV